MSTGSESENAYDATERHHAEQDAKMETDRAARWEREANEARDRNAAPALAKPAEANPPPAPKPPTSKVILDRWPTPEENTRDELGRYADVLLPGSIDRIIKAETARVGAMSPDRRAEAVAKFLASPAGQKLMDPEVSPSKLLNGQSPSPVRVALQRYGPELKPGALDQLVKAWSVELLHATPERLAGEIVRRLGRPENAQYLASPIHKVFARGFPTKVEPVRQADGTFATPPEKKRTPSGF